MRQRIYITDESFPELRELRPWHRRVSTWFNAILHGFRDWRFWLFCLVQIAIASQAIAVVLISSGSAKFLWPVLVAMTLLILIAYLQVSWGGDIMRSHLRAVNDVARHACPSCGQDLRGHLVGDDETPVRCPECGVMVPRSVFRPPFPIPREFRAFPPWG